MKRFSTILLAAALSVGAMLPAAAAEKDHRFTTSVSTGEIADAFSKRDRTGMQIEVKGRVPTGFGYRAEVTTQVLQGGGTLQTYEVEGYWLYNNAVGPVLIRKHEKLHGASELRTLAGLKAEYAIGRGVSVGGSLASDLDDFGKKGAGDIFASWQAFDKTVLTAKYHKDHTASSPLKGTSLGAVHDLGNNLHVAGELAREKRANGLEQKKLSIGVGFRF